MPQKRRPFQLFFFCPTHPNRQAACEICRLGILREEHSFAARILRERGAEIEPIRRALAAQPEEPPVSGIGPEPQE
ncbi:MAG: Clp protease N-terminal domain-containing protein [Terracidiphilus sp.]|jgi:hypothetical protein